MRYDVTRFWGHGICWWKPHLPYLQWSLRGAREVPVDELPNHNCIKYLQSLVQQQQTCTAELKRASAEHKRHLAEQKRDIQLLKQYRCATFQNWRKHEYKILEWPAGAIRLEAVLRAVSKHSLVESGCLASPVNAMVENVHKRSWSPGSGRTSDKTMNHGYCKNSVSKNIPGQQTIALTACEDLGCRNRGLSWYSDTVWRRYKSV